MVIIKTKEYNGKVHIFLFTLDESTDISETSQLLIFTRTVEKKFPEQEELVKTCSLNGGTKGLTIDAALEPVICD